MKSTENKRVINKAVYIALGVNLSGHKEILGLWVSPQEGAKFWLSVLTELNNRGVKDILIACVDGLTGFPEAIATHHGGAIGKILCLFSIIHMKFGKSFTLPMR